MSCKKQECPEPAEKYKQNIFNFQIEDAGSGVGFCGLIISAEIDSGGSFVYFKAVNLPPNVYPNPANHYKGKFEVLPEVYTSNDGRPDLRPGIEPTIYPHFVNILEWERK